MAWASSVFPVLFQLELGLVDACDVLEAGHLMEHALGAPETCCSHWTVAAVVDVDACEGGLVVVSRGNDRNLGNDTNNFSSASLGRMQAARDGRPR